MATAQEYERVKAALLDFEVPEPLADAFALAYREALDAAAACQPEAIVWAARAGEVAGQLKQATWWAPRPEAGLAIDKIVKELASNLTAIMGGCVHGPQEERG